MRDGESYDDYKLRYIGSSLTATELEAKASEAWYARRERMRIDKVNRGKFLMATKAIKITNKNYKRLEGEFGNLEENELAPHIGYWMVVGFGSEAIEGFFSDQNFNRSAIVIGTLENEWVDITLKKTLV